MGASVTIRARMPDGSPAVAADIQGINHDSWSSSHRVWRGRTDADGVFTWNNLDTGTLGDRYTFEVRFQDSRGVSWIGRASERVNSPRRIDILLSPKFDEVEEIPKGLKVTLSKTDGGRRLLELFSELDRSLSEEMSVGSIALEIEILEQLLLFRLRESDSSVQPLPGTALPLLVSQTEIVDSLGIDRVTSILRFQGTRNQVMHGREGHSSVGEISLEGRQLCLDTLKTLVKERTT